MNNFGKNLRVTIFGKSHSDHMGCVIDGCFAGINFSKADLEAFLERRKPHMPGTTPRTEDDKPKIISGIYKGKTDGTPLAILFKNKNIKSGDYDAFRDLPRPGHADFAANIKFAGYNDPRGGGMFSGRLTLPLTAAGFVAMKHLPGIKIKAELKEAGGSKDISLAVDDAIREKDSIGGIIECIIRGVKPGIGNPFFDSIESLISHIMFSIPGIKGIEFGAGFGISSMKGSEANDAVIEAGGRTKTNHSGGINGGISNGNDIIFRLAVRPAPTIGRPQETLNFKTLRMDTLEGKGRHDVCFALRLPVVVEACAAIALADLYLFEY